MKVGDLIPVNIAGDVVAQAKITNMEDGVATLEFPATRVQMSYVTQLTTEAPAPVEPAKQTIITGVDRVDADGNIVDTGNVAQVVPGESAPVVANGEDAENANGAVETPTGEVTQTEVVAPTPVAAPVAVETPVE